MAVTISSSCPGGVMLYADMLSAVRSRGLLSEARALVFQHRVDVWIVFDRLVGDYRLFTGPHGDYMIGEARRYQIVKVVRFKTPKKPKLADPSKR